eukprot:TRINITY_DN9378_c0_g1_i1.p1 TRINITY_DN9378_c0_g1~~TRINITY_DN9378_c0_g1_i1.p1  ORF type:complete len:145 (-),score=21.48 TRINITY_DN9378_c0_g1_i1:59-493(-)
MELKVEISDSEAEEIGRQYLQSIKKRKKVVRALELEERRYFCLEPRRYLTTRRIENSRFYATNQSNQKYVEKYELRNIAFRLASPYRSPPHPREKHRCAYHIEDLRFAFLHSGPKVASAFHVLKCFGSKPGEEPERFRDELWNN